ncbi:MAG: hypothetical protein KKG59_02785 [Nanoarchaeota archaeon]|nr:hypothetical protein [Nanoarchaeota archaeon]
MKIRPSLREKKRYIAYEIVSNKPIKKDMGKLLEVHIKSKLGLFDGAEAGVISVKYSRKSQQGIIRMNNKFVNKVKVAMMLANAQIMETDEDFSIHTLLVSGSINKLDHFAS